MRRQLAASVAMFGLVASTALVGQQSVSPPQPTPRFRSGVNLVLVDVVVRDRSGAVVRGLTADDFELVEDGARQQIRTFAFEDIGTNAAAIENAAALVPTTSATSVVTPGVPAAARSTAAGTPSHPLNSEEVAGHRLLTLLFDTSSM